ncbi:MAG TPA: Rieske 2Fe-2S domain-containing protein [Terriglobales bacterium]|nr:Rieske 2Fe-2S domain-containing protein [Terriglobales bacterium]
MADEVKTMAGVLGNLPPSPRKALNNSVIAAEQAYRKRSGLPLLTEEDIAALKAGEPMPWERADGQPTTAPAPAPMTAAAPAAPPTPAATTTPASAPVAAPGSAPSADAQALAKAVAKWSRSAIAAEQARRKRSDLAPLSDTDVAFLLGEPAAPALAAPAAVAPAASAAAARPVVTPSAPAASVQPASPPLTREGSAVRYVGTPAVGTSKAAAAAGVATVGPENTEVNQRRRRLVWTAVIAFLTTWLIAFFRFFLPRTLFEPSTVFKVGYPSDFGLGVDTKFQQRYRIWVDRTPDRVFVIYARCTHLGCTPDWKPAENKFKCPCHGSGYDNEGINFEGPAPRPMDRAHVELAPDGQIIVDTSRLYSWPKGQRSMFDDPGAFLRV